MPSVVCFLQLLQCIQVPRQGSNVCCTRLVRISLHTSQLGHRNNNPLCSISRAFQPLTLLTLQVVVTHWREPEPADWSSFAPKLRQLWHNSKWSSSIYVDDASLASSPQGAPSTGHLHSHLQRTSARACSICDPQAHRPFPSNVALSKHVSSQHHRHMCPVCLNVSVGLGYFCLSKHACNITSTCRTIV